MLWVFKGDKKPVIKVNLQTSAVFISGVFKMRVVLFYLCFSELGDRIQSQW